MRTSGAVLALVASLLIAVAGAGVVVASSTPPTDLKKVGDHWTPWDPPPAGPDAYVIQKGDTLWDLAEKWLGDPFLWPQVWDENRYILDSHWIYPGDPLVIPGNPTVVPETGLPPMEDDSVEPTEGPGAGSLEPVEPTEPVRREPLPAPLVPVVAPTELYCAGYIEPEHEFSPLWVAGIEMEKEHVGTGDVIYMNQGRNQGVQSGDEFAVLRVTRQVQHPATKKDLGTFVRRLGRVRVLLAQENTSSAVIELACDDIQESDELVLWEEIAIPRRRGMPEFSRYDVTESGGPTGYVVTDKEDLMAMGADNIIYSDLGVASGVKPGDVLSVFRDNGELPRMMIGQAVVLTVEPLTSTAKMTHAVRESYPGDRVEVIR